MSFPEDRPLALPRNHARDVTAKNAVGGIVGTENFHGLLWHGFSTVWFTEYLPYAAIWTAKSKRGLLHCRQVMATR